MSRSPLLPTRLLVFLAISWITVSAFATDQQLDRVSIEGEKYLFVEPPMVEYWNETRPMPKFDPTTTANWAGYTASWEIRDNKLFLVALTARVKGKPFDAAMHLGKPLPLEADWLCGPLHAVNNFKWEDSVYRYSENARRLFFVDGVLKKSMNLDRVECSRGRVGISIENRQDFSVIEEIEAGSPAETSAQLASGDIIEAFTDLDGEVIALGKMESDRARQLIRGLNKQPLTLHVRTTETDKTRVVELQRVDVFEGEFDYLDEAERK